MSLTALEHLLAAIQTTPGWQRFGYYRQILEVWPRVCPLRVLTQTRPMTLRQQVLVIATASPVLAQHLSLQRVALLNQLNSQLPYPLEELRFSSAHWHEVANPATGTARATADESVTSEPIELDWDLPTDPPDNPSQVLERWFSLMEKRREVLPLCPRCQSPTHPQELQRWSVCGCCMRESWTQNLAQDRHL